MIDSIPCYFLTNEDTLIPCIGFNEYKKMCDKYGYIRRNIQNSTININDTDINISTIFLLFCQDSFSLSSPMQIKKKPLVYETMVFGGINDNYMERYYCINEAKKRHKEIVNLCTENIKIEENED
jgi:hypothetical protein